jgi:hypothetical protein
MLVEAPAQAPSPLAEPRVYRLTTGCKWSLRVAAAGFFGAGVASLAQLFAQTESPAFFAASGAMFLVAAALGAVSLGDHLVFDGDSLELHELFSTRRLTRAQIRGRRRGSRGGLSVVAVEAGRKGLRFVGTLQSDAVLKEWLQALPDLDAEDRTRILAEALGRLGSEGSPEAHARFARARHVAVGLTVLTLAGAVWLLVDPQPYLLAVCANAALPLLTLSLALYGRGVFQLEGDARDPRPTLTTGLLLPAFAVGLRAVLDFDVLELAPLLACAALGGLPLGWLLVRSDPEVRARKRGAIFAGLLFAVWLAGLGAVLNCALDTARPTPYSAVVRLKEVQRKEPRFQVWLGPWGPVRESTWQAVSPRRYQSLTEGDHVAVDLYPGALGLRWYKLDL